MPLLAAARKHLGGLLDELDEIASTGSSCKRPASIFEKSSTSSTIASSESAERWMPSAKRLCAASRRVSSSSSRHAQHAIHRRAQLVAHARDEVALGAAEHLQLLVAFLELVRAHADHCSSSRL